MPAKKRRNLIIWIDYKDESVSYFLILIFVGFIFLSSYSMFYYLLICINFFIGALDKVVPIGGCIYYIWWFVLINLLILLDVFFLQVLIFCFSRKYRVCEIDASFFTNWVKKLKKCFFLLTLKYSGFWLECKNWVFSISGRFSIILLLREFLIFCYRNRVQISSKLSKEFKFVNSLSIFHEF